MLRSALWWVLVAALGAVLFVLITPFAQLVTICVVWVAEAPRSALVWAILLMFALTPFVAITLIFRGTHRTPNANR